MRTAGVSVAAQSAKQVPDLTKAGVEARQLPNKGDWKAAAASFRKIVTAASEDGPSWQRLGYCLHAMGELDDALEVHKKATQFPVIAGVASYNAACVYALQGNKDNAFAWLEKAVRSGLPRPEHVTTDPDLGSLRKDERYAEIVRRIKSRTKKLRKGEPTKLKKTGTANR